MPAFDLPTSDAVTPTHDQPTGRTLAKRAAKVVFTLAVVGAAVFLLHRYIERMSWHDVREALDRIPHWHVLASIACTFASWSCLAVYDVMAVETVVPGKVPLRMKIFSGYVAHAITNALGFHAITGTAIRYRLLSKMGVSTPDVARVVGLVGFAVGMGFAATICLALILEPSIANGWGRWLGMAIIVLFAALLRWLAGMHDELRVWKFTTPVPSARAAAAQMALGVIEMTGATAAMYFLVPPDIAGHFLDFAPIYVGAIIAGIISNTPGGIGAFEALTLATFPQEQRAQVLAALLAYRVIYGLAPALLSSVALGIFEFVRRRRTP